MLITVTMYTPSQRYSSFTFAHSYIILILFWGLQGINERCWIEPDYAEGKDEGNLKDDELPGHELGNIVHRVFKNYHFSEDKLKEYIKKELSVFGLDTNQKSIDLVANWVNSFYNSDIGKEVVSGKQQQTGNIIYI